MKRLFLPTTLLIISSVSILLALSLTGASLAKSVKWSFYNNNKLDYGIVFYYMYAYQNLWTSYDSWTGNNDRIHMQAFKLLKDDVWRLLPRLLIISSIILGVMSLCILLTVSLVPFLKRKSIVLNGCRIASSVISVCSGSLLAFALDNFQKHYQSILAWNFDSPGSGYPDKNSISTGFYIAAIASTFYFLSAGVNIANVVILIKAGNTTVKPSAQGSRGAS